MPDLDLTIVTKSDRNGDMVIRIDAFCWRLNLAKNSRAGLGFKMKRNSRKNRLSLGSPRKWYTVGGNHPKSNG